MIFMSDRKLLHHSISTYCMSEVISSKVSTSGSLLFHHFFFCKIQAGNRFNQIINPCKHSPSFIKNSLIKESKSSQFVLYSYSNEKPIVEIARFEAYSLLRKQLQQFLLEEGCVSRRGWIRAFERWQINAKIEENDMGHNSGDPLLPSSTIINKDLIHDLSKLDDMTIEAAQRVAMKLHQQSTIHVSKLIQLQSVLQNKLSSSEITSDRPSFQLPLVTAVRRQYDMLLSLDNLKVRHNCNVNFNRLQRLRYNWRQVHQHQLQLQNINIDIIPTINNDTISTSMTDVPFENENTEQHFLDDLFCLLLRYKALEGSGLQGAIPPPVFTQLKLNFDVEVEGFASPLNFENSHYYSVFDDTDKPFEALSQTSSPLSFILTVPAWIDDPHYNSFLRHRYLKYHMIIPANEHIYCDGQQHCRPQEFRPAPFDSGVFFLQNKQGSHNWPMNVEKEAQLREAFARIKPSEWLVRKQQNQGGLYIPKTKRGDRNQL
eukprot:gene11759-24658_t